MTDAQPTPTDQQPTPTPADVAAAAAATEDAEAAAATDNDRTPNSEAARRRHELRAAEGERDALAATVESFQRREVERILSTPTEITEGSNQLTSLHNASDIFDVAGRSVTDFLAEDGTVDPELVADGLTALLEERPYLFRSEPAPMVLDPVAVAMGRARQTSNSKPIAGAGGFDAMWSGVIKAAGEQ